VILAVLQGVIPSSSASIAASTTTDPLDTRLKSMTQAQQQSSGNGTSIGNPIGSRGAP
jgi:hypothetical protein